MNAVNINEILTKLELDIQKAKLVLIGIGFEWKWDGKSESKKEKIINAYKNLKKMLEGKNYYIISLCYDDLIYEAFDSDDNIVTPCGNRKFMQCDTHLIATEDAIEKNGVKYCPECGKKLVYNNIESEKYLEQSYLDKFAAYKKWLQGTVNRELCIIELGAGMQFPSVVRFAFDKLCYYNQKSVFYRIHDSLYQHTVENKERGVSVKKDSLEFISYFNV